MNELTFEGKRIVLEWKILMVATVSAMIGQFNIDNVRSL